MDYFEEMRNITNSGPIKFFQVEEIEILQARDSTLWEGNVAVLHCWSQTEERGKDGRDNVWLVGKWEIIKSSENDTVK